MNTEYLLHYTHQEETPVCCYLEGGGRGMGWGQLLGCNWEGGMTWTELS